MVAVCRRTGRISSDRLAATSKFGRYFLWQAPPSPGFSISVQVLILKAVKVLCFDTLLQVLILNRLWLGFRRCLLTAKRSFNWTDITKIGLNCQANLWGYTIISKRGM